MNDYVRHPGQRKDDYVPDVTGVESFLTLLSIRISSLISKGFNSRVDTVRIYCYDDSDEKKFKN